MALANARGLRESLVKSQLREIARGGLPPHANLLFFWVNRAAVDEDLPTREPRAGKAVGFKPCPATARSPYPTCVARRSRSYAWVLQGHVYGFATRLILRRSRGRAKVRSLGSEFGGYASALGGHEPL